MILLKQRAQDVGSVSTQAAGHMSVSIQKIRSRRANGHTRKCCRNSPSNAPAVTREAEEDWARQQSRRANSSMLSEDCALLVWYRCLYAPRTEGRMTVTIGRRELLAALGSAAAAWPLVARAQQQSKMLRVGFVGIEPRESALYINFLKRMAELGYQEGRNFAFEYIQTPNIESYEKSYRDLAARKVDVFLAVGNEPALRAALSAADGRPIAFLAVDFDPLAKGYVTNLSRPGSNVTG